MTEAAKAGISLGVRRTPKAAVMPFWRMGLAIPFCLLAGLALTACQQNPGEPDPEAWLNHGRTADEQRFSPLEEINTDTVGQLGLAWWSEFDTDRGQEATPLVSDGVLYTTTAWSKVFAFDAATGEALWSYDPKVPGETGALACCDVVNRGAALWDGKVYVATLDGRLIALNAKSGELEWSVQTTERSKPYTITGAPRVVKGKIVIGNAGAEFPVRGYVSAYHGKTGKLAWRFYVTPNPKGIPDRAASDRALSEIAAKTWGEGEWKKGGGGGTPWDAITFDPKSNMLFVGTGNPGPWAESLRSDTGDNLFATSIVALNPDTGQYAWHYQTTPRDVWDYDAVQHMIVADLPNGGGSRRVVMQANKNGFFYVLDAKTGKLVSADNFVPTDWAVRIDLVTGRPVENGPARYTAEEPTSVAPGALGAHNWQPMAYSPQHHLVYIPTMVNRGSYAVSREFEFTEGIRNTGMDLARRLAPRRSTGELLAWDPVAQKARWRISYPFPWKGGVLATGGNLVFHPAGNELIAYNAGTGERLWSYDTLARPIAAPMTYAIDGTQYVALMVGYGGAGGIRDNQPRRPGRLLVFKLKGTAKQKPHTEFTPAPPLDLAEAEPSSGNVKEGQSKFTALCSACHGTFAFLPDLSRSPAILNRDTFAAVVIDGVLKENGMASFKRYLTPQEVESIRAHLLSQARVPRQGALPSEPTHAQ